MPLGKVHHYQELGTSELFCDSCSEVIRFGSGWGTYLELTHETHWLYFDSS